jgi:hypothetical protein
MCYPIEEIPDEDSLFYRVHSANIDKSEIDNKKRIKPGAFDPQPKPHGVEMSTDWSKYSTCHESRNRARKPENNGIISFIVGDIRRSPTPLSVLHRPTLNQAHSIVCEVIADINNPEIRIKLRRICKWELII